MTLYWDEEKTQHLKAERGVSFEEIEILIWNWAKYFLEDSYKKEHYSHQKILYVPKDDYMIEIPCVSHLDGYFCKTLYPSRKATKRFLNL